MVIQYSIKYNCYLSRVRIAHILFQICMYYTSLAVKREQNLHCKLQKLGITAITSDLQKRLISCEVGLAPLERIGGKLHKLDLSHLHRILQELVQMNTLKTWAQIQL